MSDPIWTKVHELLEGYPPEFNAQAAYDVVKEAWKMGFDVVRAPAGSDLFGNAIRAQNDEIRNTPPSLRGLFHDLDAAMVKNGWTPGGSGP